MSPAITHQGANCHRTRKTIVFVLPYPPPPHFHRSFFVRELQEAHVVAEYWDVGPILGYDVKFTSEVNGLQYRKVSSLRELQTRLRRAGGPVVFLPQIGRTIESVPIYFLLWWFNKKTVFFGRGFLPYLSRSDNTFRYRLRKLLKATNRKALLVRSAYAAILKLLPAIKKHDVVFVAGAMAERVHATDAITMVRIHHFDVDAAAANEPAPAGLPSDYCVFLDDYLPFHPDFRITRNRTINPEAYYRSLNKFFDSIEHQYDTQVVIAASPKAVYDTNPFDSRLIIVNATEALVRGAQIVFAHASTAVSFAVIHGKPLCLLFTDEIRVVHQTEYAQMRKTAGILGCPIVNCDTNNDAAFPPISVDAARYKHYYREFLSSGVGSGGTAQIVVDEINRLLERER